VVGLNTNIEFLGKLATHPSFIEGDVETGFIEVPMASFLHLCRLPI
jgi:3-methylcrotonyl-CoA carboxylase alpha subunit